MDVKLKPGTYVVAVSGGVDSMALLDVLRRKPELRLIVAHFDHGIRPDSYVDRRLVQEITRRYGLQFVYDYGALGSDASEAAARKARYDFLHKVRRHSNARAIVTAHHQDDLLETAVLNLLRGTNRKGLTSLRSTDTIKRPLLSMPKQELIDHARDQRLLWREDSTNGDTRYLRNYIRRHIMPRFSAEQREAFVQLLSQASHTNQYIDAHVANHLHMHPGLATLDRHTFIMLSHQEAREVMAAWLRRSGIRQFDRRTLERLVMAAKTFKAGQKTDIDINNFLLISRYSLALLQRDR